MSRRSSKGGAAPHKQGLPPPSRVHTVPCTSRPVLTTTSNRRQHSCPAPVSSLTHRPARIAAGLVAAAGKHWGGLCEAPPIQHWQPDDLRGRAEQGAERRAEQSSSGGGRGTVRPDGVLPIEGPRGHCTAIYGPAPLKLGTAAAGAGESGEATRQYHICNTPPQLPAVASAHKPQRKSLHAPLKSSRHPSPCLAQHYQGLVAPSQLLLTSKKSSRCSPSEPPPLTTHLRMPRAARILGTTSFWASLQDRPGRSF